jgi:hypothetical protein
MWRRPLPGSGRSGCDQGPASRQSWSPRAAEENVVAEIPDRGLTRASIVKEVIRFVVAVEIGNAR